MWSRIVSWASSITPRSRTTATDLITLEPACMTSLPSGIFLRLQAVPNRSNSVLFPFNCRRLEAHQPLTSAQQSLRFDINCGTSAGRQCSISRVSSANRWWARSCGSEGQWQRLMLAWRLELSSWDGREVYAGNINSYSAVQYKNLEALCYR